MYRYDEDYGYGWNCFHDLDFIEMDLLFLFVVVDIEYEFMGSQYTTTFIVAFGCMRCSDTTILLVCVCSMRTPQVSKFSTAKTSSSGQ